MKKELGVILVIFINLGHDTKEIIKQRSRGPFSERNDDAKIRASLYKPSNACKTMSTENPKEGPYSEQF